MKLLVFSSFCFDDKWSEGSNGRENSNLLRGWRATCFSNIRRASRAKNTLWKGDSLWSQNNHTRTSFGMRQPYHTLVHLELCLTETNVTTIRYNDTIHTNYKTKSSQAFSAGRQNWREMKDVASSYDWQLAPKFDMRRVSKPFFCFLQSTATL